MNKMVNLYITFLSCYFLLNTCSTATRIRRDSNGPWQMPLFPLEPASSRNKQIQNMKHDLYDSKKENRMGISSDICDNGMTNLTLDWDYKLYNYICWEFPDEYAPKLHLSSNLLCDQIPVTYQAQHVCMDEKIEYLDNIPTFGNHRPLWPKYGEYTFLPPQRWLHTLEHGGIVMLYHPCANIEEVELLKWLVKSCLQRYVITPSPYLTKEKPLGLVAWGCKLLMPKVYQENVVQFIRKNAFKGPEQMPKDGQFSQFLISPVSKIGLPEDEQFLCPNFL